MKTNDVLRQRKNGGFKFKQPKRYCLLVKIPLARNIAVRKTDDKICNTALFHLKLARPRSINVRIPMVYIDLLYLYLLMRKYHTKCGPAADRLGCRISIKMASQPCGGTIANTVRVFTAWHPTPSQYTDTGSTCRCAINLCGTLHWNTQPISMSWVRPDWEILPRSSTHTSERSTLWCFYGAW